MMKLCVPLGKAIVVERAGRKRPVVLLDGKALDGLTYLEMDLYIAMQWHICDMENLETYYYKKTLIDQDYAKERLETCLGNMQAKGLIACVEGAEKLETLYRLLCWRSASVHVKSMNERILDYRILRERKMPVSVAIQVFKCPWLTLLEKKMLHNIKAVPKQSIYELILTLKDRQMPNKFEAQEALLYVQLLDEQQACLDAIISLFLKKQIIFE